MRSAGRGSPPISMARASWRSPSATGCDAIHPGYGFLAENAAFARAVADAGLTFIGPSPEALDLFGDKVLAREFAARCGAPVIEGAVVRSVEEARAFFDRRPARRS